MGSAFHHWIFFSKYVCMITVKGERKILCLNELSCTQKCYHGKMLQGHGYSGDHAFGLTLLTHCFLHEHQSTSPRTLC